MQVVQSPKSMGIYMEDDHAGGGNRVIFMDGRPQLPLEAKFYLGDSRGHWEGNTLVVETTNFSQGFRGSNIETYKMIERFTRVDAELCGAKSPSTIPRRGPSLGPFSSRWEGHRDRRHMIFDSACHEGNYGMTGILVGARREEQAGPGKSNTSIGHVLLPLLLLLSFGSGVAALIYEVVWFQLLELVIGSTAVSLGVLLATFMGGMCLGSLMLPRLVSARRHPLRVYALIELGIGVLGILVLHLMPFVGGVYTAWSGYGLRGFLLRGVVAAACLLPPTLLMGATLPALARQIECGRRGVSWLGFLLRREYRRSGIWMPALWFLFTARCTTWYAATYVAVAINLAMAGLALALALLDSARARFRMIA